MATSLELAISAIRSGRREEGRQLLNLLIQQNPNNELAWLWMSSVVENDEQRARCLYHVLAINPNNTIARQGLKVLGIVVSDSRPVKVPRDSQPIKISRQPANPQTGPLKALPEPRSPLARASERRPFRIDPQTIVEELPFTPVKDPFSKPTPVAQAGSPANPQNTSEPVVPIQQNAAIPASPSGQSAAVPPTGNVVPDTRPTHPVPASAQAANTPMGMPMVPPQSGSPHPSEPVPVIHSNATMMMPSPQPYSHPSQPMPGFHAQATMGMPAQYQNNQMPHPSEPIPVIHSNTTMGMPLPAYLQGQYMPQSQAFQPNSAMTLAAAYPSMNNYQMMQPTPARPPQSRKRHKVEEEEEEGMNILAVIIFGSLSVTALGGLGMLILLMFTTG
jgi:hypothetical protein